MPWTPADEQRLKDLGGIPKPPVPIGRTTQIEGLPLVLNPDMALEGTQRLDTPTLVRIIKLAREVFDHVPDDDWKLSETTLPSGNTIVHLTARLGSTSAKSYCMLTLDINGEATAAHLAEIRSENPVVYTGGERKSHIRMGLRSKVWSDFVGWFSVAKELWEGDLKPKMFRYRVAKRHGFFDIRTQQPVRFPVGSLVEIRNDMRAIRAIPKDMTARKTPPSDDPEWAVLSSTDMTSGIPRAISKGVLEKI